MFTSHITKEVINCAARILKIGSQIKILCQKNKNAAEVDIAPASGKIIKNMTYRSRAPGQGARV